MNPLKAELAQMVELLDEQHETAEACAKAIYKLVDAQMAERSVLYSAAFNTSGGWRVVGPYSTLGQAQRAVQAGLNQTGGLGAVVHHYFPEGWAQHMSRVDAPAAPRGDFAVVAADAAAIKAGWRGKKANRDEYISGS